MTQIILIVVGIVVVVILISRRSREAVTGICAAAMGQDARKREHKERILALLADNNPLSPVPEQSSVRGKAISSLAPATPPRGLGTPPRAGGDGERQEGTSGFSNADIREALSISERSVVRYLDELEREGKVEQVGSTGRSVTYRLKQ